jgi:hypothetical protein
VPPGVALEQPHAQQAQLISFFVNPLLTTASGAVTPAEAIPHWLQPLVFIDPIRHFSVIARSNLIKGTGFAALWVDFLMLWSKSSNSTSKRSTAGVLRLRAIKSWVTRLICDALGSG